MVACINNYHIIIHGVQVSDKSYMISYSSSLSTELIKRTIAGGRLSSLMEKMKC